jgi:hypothetical protein
MGSGVRICSTAVARVAQWLGSPPGSPPARRTTRWESVPVLVAGLFASTVESSIGLSASVCTFDAQDGALTLDAEDNAISDLRCWITFKDAAPTLPVGVLAITVGGACIDRVRQTDPSLVLYRPDRDDCTLHPGRPLDCPAIPRSPHYRAARQERRRWSSLCVSRARRRACRVRLQHATLRDRPGATLVDVGGGGRRSTSSD